MRLIDADDLAAKIMMEAPDLMDGGSSITKAFILAMVKTRSVTPTIDAVQVVRCKDCKYWSESEIYRYRVCNRWKHQISNFATSPDWFCRDGKRKSD
jgi:hypothetical protein